MTLRAVGRHGRSVRTRGQAADLRRQRGDAQGQDNGGGRGRAFSQHGTVAPITLHHRTDFAASMIDGRTVMEVDPDGRSAAEVVALWKYISDRLEKNFRRTVFRRSEHAGGGAGRLSSRRRFRPPGRPVSAERVEAAAMSESSFASLSPALLARKGGAKPAMRPQNTAGVTDAKSAAASLEDLGWNDMGDEEAAQTARVVSIGSAAANPSSVFEQGPEPSPVRATLDRIAAKLEAPVQSARPNALKKAANDSRRAAFTLRLDQERHLKLRLACTVRGRSAQQLVTDALDVLLAQMPEIDSLAAQVLRD